MCPRHATAHETRSFTTFSCISSKFQGSIKLRENRILTGTSATTSKQLRTSTNMKSLYKPEEGYPGTLANNVLCIPLSKPGQDYPAIVDTVGYDTIHTVGFLWADSRI